MKVRIRRPWLTTIWLFLLAPIIAVLVLAEWTSVSREECHWGTDQFCSDVDGLYGLAALAITIVLIIALLVINRDRSSYR